MSLEWPDKKYCDSIGNACVEHYKRTYDTHKSHAPRGMFVSFAYNYL